MELSEGWEEAGQRHPSSSLSRFRPWPECRDQAVVTVVSGAALGHEAWNKKEQAHWFQVKGLVEVGGAPPWSSVWCTGAERRRGCESVCAFRGLKEGH